VSDAAAPAARDPGFPPRPFGVPRLPAADARRVIRATQTVRTAPVWRAMAARDAAVLALAAYADLPAEWLAGLRWCDVGSDPCGGIALAANGLAVHVCLPPGVMAIVEGWRARLALAIGRPPGPGEPVFPRGRMTRRQADRPLLPAGAPLLRGSATRRLRENGVPDELAGLGSLRGALVGTDPADLDANDEETGTGRRRARGALPPGRAAPTAAD
jgi:hypothetical protein